MSRLNLAARIDRLEHRQKLSQLGRRGLPDWLEPALIEGGLMSSNLDASSWHYDALPAQRTFHGDVTTRFKGYSGPIGSGKSYALAYEALFLSQLNPGLMGLIGAPTYRMLEDATQRTFFDVLEREGINYTFTKHDNRVRFPETGSEVIFRTMENPERLRGPNLAWFALDELTYTHEEAWTRILGRLRHPQARRLCGCAVWTPKGYDWVHKRFVEEKNRDYGLVHATPRENKYLPPDFYDQLKESYAERFYRQEVLGEYLDIFGGNMYYAFSEENVTEVGYDRCLPLSWALDFNVDPLCSVICQIEERRTMYSIEHFVRVIDEITLRNSNTVAATEEFIRRVSAFVEGPRPILVKIYGDASGNQRTTKASRTDYELIKEVFRGHPEFTIHLRQNTSNPPIKDRVNAVNNMLKSAAGTRSILIDPSCKELIKDFRQIRWQRDSAGNPTGEIDKSDTNRTHVSDALSYMIIKEFGMRPVGGPRAGYLA